MAKRKTLDPLDIDRAIDFYAAILSERDVTNPLRLPRDPEELVELISAAAFRVDRQEMVSQQLARITRKELKDTAPTADVKSDIGLPLKVDPVKLGQLESLITTIKRQYEPIPEGADAKGAALAAASVMMDAAIITGLMKAKGWGMDQVLGSAEYERAMSAAREDMASQQKELANNPFYERFVKDYPVTGDVITIGFLGGAGAALIPVREVLVHALIAADDPDVRAHAANFVNMFDETDSATEFNAMLDAAGKRLEKAYFSKELQQRRFPIDVVLGSALTSPVFLKAVGIPESLPKNLVYEGLSGIKKKALSLRSATENQVTRSVIDFFRDGRTVRSEKFFDHVLKRLEQSLGPETGPEIVASVRAQVEAQVKEIATSGAKREEIGWNIFRTTYDAVRSRMADLSQAEKVAVLYRVQGRRDLLDVEHQLLWDTPRVAEVAEQMENALESVFRAELMGKISGYWPAYKAFAEGRYAALRSALQDGSSITYKKVFHGTNDLAGFSSGVDVARKRLGGDVAEGFSVTTSRDIASGFGGDVIEFRLRGSARIAGPSDLPEVKLTTFSDGEVHFNAIDAIRAAREKGFDAVDIGAFDKLTGQRFNEEIRILNPNVLLREGEVAASVPTDFSEEILTRSSSEPFRRKRLDTEVVTATVDTIDDRIDDLIFRIAAPRVNAIVRGVSNDAKTVASLVMNAVDESLMDPMKTFKMVGQALSEVPGSQPSQANLLIREFINTAFLTTRVGAWALIDGMDKAVAATSNVLTRIKSGKAVSVREILNRAPVPVDILDKTVSHPFSAELINVWRPVAWVRAFNDVAYRANKFLDDFSNSAIYRLNYGSELKQLSRETGLAVEALEEPAKQLAAQRALDSTKDFALAFSFQSALTTVAPSALLWPYLGFYTKAAGRLMRDLGRTPELLKAGAFALHKVREANAQYPEDWQKESIEIAGRRTNLPRKFVSYPVVRVLADSYFGAPKDTSEMGRLEERAKKLESINNPILRLEMMEVDQRDADATGRSSLQDYMIQRTGRAAASFLQSVADLQALPLGPGFTIAGRALGMLEERTPHIIPGGRQLTQFFQAIGLEHIDPEGFLIPSVKAWNEANFDADVAMEALVMTKRGEAAAIIEKGGAPALKKEALDRVRVRMLNDLWTNRMLGLGREIEPETQGLYNKLNELRSRPDLFVPSNKEISSIMEKTGVNNLELVDMLWRESYLRTFDLDKKIADDRNAFYETYPELRAFKTILANRRSAMAVERVKDHFDIMRSLPADARGEWLKQDRLTQAFIKSYKGDVRIDADGNTVFEINFDADDNVGPTLWDWTQMTQDQRLKRFKEGTPDNRLIEMFWPMEFEKLRSMSPVPAELGNDDTSLRPESPLFRLATQPIEELARTEIARKALGFLSDLGPVGPLDFPNSAARVFMEKTGEGVEAYIERGKKTLESFTPENVIEFLMRPLVSTVEGAEPDYMGTTSEKIRTGREILTNPQTPEQRALRSEYLRRVKRLEKLAPGLTTTKGWNEARAEFDANWKPYGDLTNLLKADPDRNFIYNQIALPQATMKPGQNASDLTGTVIGEALGRQYYAAKQELISGLTEGVQDPKYFAARKKQLQSFGQEGKTYWDALRFSWPALVDEVNMREKGATYQLGFYSLPTFEEGQEAAKATYFDLAFAKPGETRLQWDKRYREEVAKLEPVTYRNFTGYMREKGKLEVVDATEKVRVGQFAVLPLDRSTFRALDSFKDFLLTNGDDTALLSREIQKDPELTEIMRQNDPRTYRTMEGKLFGDLNSSALKYLQASGYSPESVDRVRRLNPSTFSRLYHRNPEFQAAVRGLGFEEPPQPPDIITSLQLPEPLAPQPIPDGIFSNFTNMINYVQRRSRQQTLELMTAPREALTPAELEFIDAEPAAQVFMTFPGVIGQGFTEGKLGPQEVISQFRGLADYGLVTGALGPEQHSSFAGFLQNSSTVFGATNFGFRLGQFLDDTFNVPRLPINNKFIDFALAGGPVSGGAPLLPGERLRPIVPTASPDPFPSIPGAPLSPAAQGFAAPNTQAGEAGAATAGAGAAVAAGSGLPVIGAVFAVISAGFTISNLVKSSKARKKASRDAQRAREEQDRQIEEARRQAILQQSIAEQRDLAQDRLRQFERTRREQDQDFARRSDLFLRSGASFATFSQQPKQFQNRFIDSFPTEILEFSRRPQFPSRLNLIQSVQGRLPRPRF